MRANLLRELRPDQHARVGFAELFFDLVFVFAVIQISHTLIDSFSLLGMVETLILFLALWWVWIDTSWVTNWLDPERRPVRLLLLALAFAGLILSTSIPEAFGDRGLVFAGAYIGMQVGRCLFMLWALKDRDQHNFLNFQRITIWRAASAALWLAGGLAGGWPRTSLWALAALIDTLAPAVGFAVPRFGRSTIADWHIHGDHMAERCGLFVIIALGETILIAGWAYAEDGPRMATTGALIVAFVEISTLWWIYFDSGQERGSERIAHAVEPGELGRLAYTYFHIPITAGIVVCAVSGEFVLSHPDARTDPGAAAVILGGPAAYLLGTLLFKRSISDRWPLSHIAGVLLLGLSLPLATETSLLGLAGIATLILVLVAASESFTTRTVGSRR
jgi:low temperature requirement protein LtrA